MERPSRDEISKPGLGFSGDSKWSQALNPQPSKDHGFRYCFGRGPDGDTAGDGLAFTLEGEVNGEELQGISWKSEDRRGAGLVGVGVELGNWRSYDCGRGVRTTW